MSDHTCAGCVYQDSLRGDDPVFRYCNYIGHTGHARSLICPPGALCTVKETKRRASGGKRGPKEKIDAEAVRRLAAEGKTDQVIADALGMSKTAVRKCRWRHDIPPGVPRRGWGKNDSASR